VFFTSLALHQTPYVHRMGRRTEAPAADGSLVEAAAEAARGGSHLPSLFSAGYRRPRLWAGVWTLVSSSSAALRLAGGLRGGGACVQRRTRRDKESSRRGGRVADVTRVCRIGRRHDGGGGGGSGGRWNGVGRGRWGARGRVHRQDCASGRAEARIGR
jgi:hypothetical protein